MASMADPTATMVEMAKALSPSDQWRLLESLLSNLKGSPLKTLSAKKAKDPNAPKREVKPDSYIHLVNQVVWPVLKAMGELAEDEAEKKVIRSVSARTQVGSALWNKVKALSPEERGEAIAEISETEIEEAQAAWKANPPEPHCKADKEARAAKSSASSVASAGTKASSGSKKKLADMTEEEKAAFYKARGAASAAARAAKKAAAAEAPKEAPKAKEEAEEAEEVMEEIDELLAEEPKKDEAEAEADEMEVAPQEWEHDFGEGVKKQERLEVDGMAYIQDFTTKAQLGAFMEKTNKLNKRIADPTA